MRAVLSCFCLIMISSIVVACGDNGGGRRDDGDETDTIVDQGDSVDQVEDEAGDIPVGEGCRGDDDCDDGDPCTVEICDHDSRECVIVSTIDTCQNNDLCCPEGCDPSNDTDCGSLTLPRLVVVDEYEGIMIWNNADSINSDTAADALLDDFSGEAVGAAVYEDRLIVATTDSEFAFHIYANLSTIESGQTYSDRISVDAVGGSAIMDVAEMSTDSSGNLWTVLYQGSIWLIEGGARLGSGSPAQVEFSHPWSQINSMVMDNDGNKLLGGQISGAGIIVWNDPMTRTGTGNENDWELHALDPTSLVIHSDRLYAGCWNPPFIQIWNNISDLVAPAAPHVTLAESSGLESVWHLFLRENVMIASVHDVDVSKINVYRDAMSIEGETAPNYEITDPLLSWPKKAYLDKDENLFVMDEDSILIFQNAASSPALKTSLTAASSPNDFLVVE